MAENLAISLHQDIAEGEEDLEVVQLERLWIECMSAQLADQRLANGDGRHSA